MLCAGELGSGAATIGCDLSPMGPNQSVILGSAGLCSLVSILCNAPFIQFSQLVITGVPLPLRWRQPLRPHAVNRSSVTGAAAENWKGRQRTGD